jgi:hypothetical protein
MLTPRTACNLSAHLQKRAATYIEVCKNLREAAITAKKLKQYIEEKKEGDENSSSKLIKLGIALIALPEPILSDALGTALIAAGLLKRKARKIGVRDVYREMYKAANRIKEAAEYLIFQ